MFMANEQTAELSLPKGAFDFKKHWSATINPVALGTGKRPESQIDYVIKNVLEIIKAAAR
jgi:hypothetical protein